MNMPKTNDNENNYIYRLAQLTEQVVALQRQIMLLHTEVERSEARSRDLTDAKFVTYRTLIDSQAERVKLALEATEKAIDKAEVATGKAIEKEAESNNDRFAKVNEFRAQQTELIGRFATREGVDLAVSNILDRIQEVTDRMTELATRQTASESVARGAAGNRNGIYAALGGAVAIISIIVVIANLLAR